MNTRPRSDLTPTATRLGFPPIEAPDARILILGSMPGEASLLAAEYYAHPANAFWRIMGKVYGFDCKAPYAARVSALIRHRIALWDVLYACRRTGSLDSQIDPTSEIANDLRGFFATHRDLKRVIFNGTKAESVFRREFKSSLRISCGVTSEVDLPQLLRVPSTSPAHASRTLAEKTALWQAALQIADH